MLKAGGNTENGRLVMIGLTERNVVALKDQRPILADLADFGLGIPGKILIFYGPTHGDLINAVRESGVELPEEVSIDPAVTREEARWADDKNTVIVTVGQGTAREKWAVNSAFPVISLDAVREETKERFVAAVPDVLNSVAKMMVRVLFSGGHRAVVIDGENLTREAREDWNSPITYFSVHGEGFEPLGPDEKPW